MHSPAANLHDSDSTMMAVETISHGERAIGDDKMRGKSYQAYDFMLDEDEDDRLFPRALFVPESMSRSFLVGSTTSMSSSLISGGRDGGDDDRNDEDRQDKNEFGEEISEGLQEPSEDAMHHDGVPFEYFDDGEDHQKVSSERHNNQHHHQNSDQSEYLELSKDIDRQLMGFRLVSEYFIPGHEHSAHSCMLYDPYELSKPYELVDQGRDSLMDILSDMLDEDEEGEGGIEAIIRTNNFNILSDITPISLNVSEESKAVELQGKMDPVSIFGGSETVDNRFGYIHQRSSSDDDAVYRSRVHSSLPLTIG